MSAVPFLPDPSNVVVNFFEVDYDTSSSPPTPLPASSQKIIGYLESMQRNVEELTGPGSPSLLRNFFFVSPSVLYTREPRLLEPVNQLRETCTTAANLYQIRLASVAMRVSSRTARVGDPAISTEDLRAMTDRQQQYEPYLNLARERVHPYFELADNYKRVLFLRQLHIIRPIFTGCMVIVAAVVLGILFPTLPLTFALAAKVACLPCVGNLILIGLSYVAETTLTTEIQGQIDTLRQTLSTASTDLAGKAVLGENGFVPVPIPISS